MAIRQQVFLHARLGIPTVPSVSRFPANEVFSDRLPDISQPTMIVWGANDEIVPVADADEYERLIPEARKVIFEDTGHMAMLERPARFNALLDEFLRSG